jgi:hypothetical protein
LPEANRNIPLGTVPTFLNEKLPCLFLMTIPPSVLTMDTASAGRTEEGIDKSASGSDVQCDVQNESSVMEAVIARLEDLQRDLDDVKKSVVP